MTSGKDLYDTGALVFEFLSKHLAGAKTVRPGRLLCAWLAPHDPFEFERVKNAR